MDLIKQIKNALSTTLQSYETRIRTYVAKFTNKSAKQTKLNKKVRGVTQQVIKYIGGNMNLKDLTTLTCQQYIMDIYENGRVNKERAKNNKKEIGLSSRTIKSVKIVLHAALQKAVDEEIIIKNPTNNLNLPKGRERE